MHAHVKRKKRFSGVSYRKREQLLYLAAIAGHGILDLNGGAPKRAADTAPDGDALKVNIARENARAQTFFRHVLCV